MNWAGVRERVLALGEAPFSEKVFGARGHRFRLEPPLGEAEVAAAEAELGISIPPAYRSFLLEVAAGGAGPDYGLSPLRHDGQGWHWDADRGRQGAGALLGLPFPSTEERARWAREHDAREPAEANFPDQESYRTAFRAWDDDWERLDEQMTAGAVCLVHQGCAYYTWFVVTGPDRGTLWTDLRAVDGPIEPLTRGPYPLDFQAWYLKWLDRATSQAHGLDQAPPE